jgi:hypothetical protein
MSHIGVKFAVNGFRADAIEVLREDTELRFWRDTDLARAYATGRRIKTYRTVEGYLGYEVSHVYMFVDCFFLSVCLIYRISRI